MARILTGIQSSGKPHLGNLLGAILPAVALSRRADADGRANESLYFIADLHSLTTIKDAAQRRENTRAVATAWLACGLDAECHLLYRQSDRPEVAELAWYLNCFAPYPMLANAHSFKDKADRLADVNAGLFTYPVLMAADILLYDAHLVPVGKDQKQHLEMTRDLARAMNHTYGEGLFVVPEPMIDARVMTVPGLDGEKMSKSRGNVIDLFQPDKRLRKNVMAIVTDSTPLEAPKNPDGDNVFALYQLLATPEQTAEMRARYLAGNYGYGHAKQALFELLKERFGEVRERYAYYEQRPDEVEAALTRGAERAQALAAPVLARTRAALGFGGA
ncbi:MAG: tryptophan--tRNA ligase [Catalinimonas sp.]